MPNFDANNNSSSRDMLINRQVYNGYILTLLEDVSEPTLETAQIKDFQKDEKLLYGRLDAAVRNTIFPKPQYITGFSTGRSDGLTAVSYVVRAFNDMKFKFDRDFRNGSIDPNSPALSDLTIAKAYANPIDEYNNYTRLFAQQFFTFVSENGYLKTLSDFASFVPIFMEYVNLVSKNIPITRSMFFLSKYISPRSTGLVLEIYEGDYGDDKLKEELFYRDRNFEYLKNLAYVFGFMIDKHIPWRLVADLNSPRMKRYIRETIGPEEPDAGTTLLTTHTLTYPDDTNMLVDLMVSCYNEVARMRPRTNITSPASTVNKNSAMTTFGENCRTKKTIYRSQITSQEVTSQFAPSYFLNIYAKIRNLETGLQYSEGIMRNITKNATDLANSLDTDTALGYIARKFDNVEHFNGSLFYDVTRLDLAEDPNASEQDVEEVVRRSVQASNFVIY